MDDERTRRDLLRAAGIGGAVGLAGVAGCSSLTSPGLPASPESGPADPADPTGPAATFRGGLARTGFYPDHSTPDDPRVAWTHPVNTGDHTAAKASAVPLRPDAVGEDRPAGVVIPGDDGTVYAVAPDGDLLWTAETEPSERGIHGTPTVAGDTVYVGAYDGALYALDRETGRRRWRVRLGDAIGSSPVYHDGRVYIAVEYVPPDGSLFAVGARTGSVEANLSWPADHPHSTCALAPDAGRIVVGSNDGDLYAWTLPDLDPAWEFETGDAIKGPVAIHDGTAIVGSWDHTLSRVDLADGEVRWRYEAADKVMSGPAVDPRRGTVYVGSHDRHLHAVDLADGEARWRYGTRGRITGCPSVVGDRIVVGSYGDRLHAVTPDGDRDWTVEMHGWVTASPRPVDGRLHVAERASGTRPGRAYAID